MSTEVDRSGTKETVGLVLAGGGARGAYELGALSVLLPRLESEGHGRPKVIIGTSVGAINAAYLSSVADVVSLQPALDEGCDIWREMRWGKALKSIWSPRLPLQSALDAFRVPFFHSRSLLDPAPLRETLEKGPLTEKIEHGLDFEQIHRNVVSGDLTAAAVVGTLSSTSRSVVFYDGAAPHAPPDDELRGIEYAPAELTVEHVLASAAIPSAFPAQWVSTPPAHEGWYYDGGTRLNTPIKPAIDFDVDRLIVIALNAYHLCKIPPWAVDQRPETLDGAAQLIQAVLIDPLVNDIHTLTTVNDLVQSGGTGMPGPGKRPKRLIPYIVVAPDDPYAIAAIARKIYAKRYGGARNAPKLSRSLGFLGHLLDVGDSDVRGELISYLLFDADFAAELVTLGQRDADRWLGDKSHDMWPWRTLPPP